MHAARKSAIGPANMIPSMPKNVGSTTISGIRHKSCLVIPSMVPFFGIPIDVKYVDASG